MGHGRYGRVQLPRSYNQVGIRKYKKRDAIVIVDEIKKLEDFRYELLLIQVKLDGISKEMNKDLNGACGTITKIRTHLLNIITKKQKQSREYGKQEMVDVKDLMG